MSASSMCVFNKMRKGATVSTILTSLATLFLLVPAFYNIQSSGTQNGGGDSHVSNYIVFFVGLMLIVSLVVSRATAAANSGVDNGEQTTCQVEKEATVKKMAIASAVLYSLAGAFFFIGAFMRSRNSKSMAGTVLSVISGLCFTPAALMDMVSASYM